MTHFWKTGNSTKKTAQLGSVLKTKIQAGADVINKFKHSVAVLHWNKALWLVENCHVTCTMQSECFI